MTFAAIWDMDGVLVDTSRAHYQSWVEALASTRMTRSTGLITGNGSGRNRIRSAMAINPIHCQRILIEERCFDAASKITGFILGPLLIYRWHIGWTILAEGLVDGGADFLGTFLLPG